LILAEPSEVSSLINSRKHKAPVEDMAEYIETLLGEGSSLNRADITDKLSVEFKASARTIATRINEIMDAKTEFFNNKGESCKLSKETIDKVVYFKLITNELA
jgi:hypothetical protein